MDRYCIMCGNKMEEKDIYCINCGSDQKPKKNNKKVVVSQTQEVVQTHEPKEKSKIGAGILGIFLGWLGIHNFYLGNTERGIVQIVLTLLTCSFSGLWGMTEGVLILLGYITEDANGCPLK